MYWYRNKCHLELISTTHMLQIHCFRKACQKSVVEKLPHPDLTPRFYNCMWMCCIYKRMQINLHILFSCIHISAYMLVLIYDVYKYMKMSGSECEAKKKHACISSGLCDHYCNSRGYWLFTRMVALNF